MKPDNYIFCSSTAILILILAIFYCTPLYASEGALLSETKSLSPITRTQLSSTRLSAASDSCAYLVNSPVVIQGNQTIQSNCSIRFEDDGKIYLPTGETLVINGSMQAAHAQIFDGPGKVIFGPGSIRDVIPQWFGAKGDGRHDDTDAFRKAIDSLSTFSYTNPNISRVTNTGGGKLFVPSGTYLVTGTLFFPASFEISGTGLSSHIRFLPASDVHLFENNPAKASKYSDKRATVEQVTFKDLLLTSNARGNGIHAVNVERLLMDNVVIYNFKTGLNLLGAGGESYYHTIRNCNIYNCGINMNIENAANTTVVGGYFWHTNDFDKADYTIIVKSSGVTFIGASIEGRPNIAQVYDLGRNTVYVGGYSETRNYKKLGLKPFLKKKFSNSSGIAGSTVIAGTFNFTALFEDFDLISSDVDDATSIRYPAIIHANNAIFLPVILNGNMRHGMFGWQQSGNARAGTIRYDPDVSFNSYGSLRFEHDGSGKKNGISLAIPAAELAPYVGRRIWISFLVKMTDSSFLEAFLYGSGNKQTKFSRQNVIDYGNGWVLRTLDIPVLSKSDNLVLQFNQIAKTPGAIMDVTNVQAFSNGFEIIPVNRDVLLFSLEQPASGAWRKGDRVYARDPALIGYEGWICTSDGVFEEPKKNDTMRPTFKKFGLLF